MNYNYRNGKYVFERDGVYFALTFEQLCDMLNTLIEIKQEKQNGEDDF